MNEEETPLNLEKAIDAGVPGMLDTGEIKLFRFSEKQFAVVAVGGSARAVEAAQAIKKSFPDVNVIAIGTWEDEVKWLPLDQSGDLRSLIREVVREIFNNSLEAFTGDGK